MRVAAGIPHPDTWPFAWLQGSLIQTRGHARGCKDPSSGHVATHRPDFKGLVVGKERLDDEEAPSTRSGEGGFGGQLLMLQMLQRMTEYLQEEEVPPATDLVDSLFCVTCQDFMRSGLVAPSAKVKAQAVQLLVHITCYHTSFAMELVSLYSSPAHLTPIRGERPNDRRERCGLPGLVLDILEDSSQSMQVEELQVLQWCTYLIIEVVKRAREQGWQLSQAGVVEGLAKAHSMLPSSATQVLDALKKATFEMNMLKVKLVNSPEISEFFDDF
ncbi:hypothetical protein CYMTET_35884 [Cymbomonas tetramitiformis]|uniref:Uncharacterized protein n=1 Tax=Cymbomonas tetramitiformis TaxID=36881 RepID=A0AAE0F8B0_9CHLO|nr:hypothetical protein CYMTET_35884 [Cymbomonas tetramitiformis]